MSRPDQYFAVAEPTYTRDAAGAAQVGFGPVTELRAWLADQGYTANDDAAIRTPQRVVEAIFPCRGLERMTNRWGAYTRGEEWNIRRLRRHPDHPGRYWVATLHQPRASAVGTGGIV